MNYVDNLASEKLDPRLLKEVGDLDTENFHKSDRIAIGIIFDLVKNLSICRVC